MSKKRPRTLRPAPPSRNHSATRLRIEPEYWQHRLFKNSYTYRGRSVRLQTWSVKIQLFGRRKTFSLSSRDRKSAGAEACQIYQTLLHQGWEVVTRRIRGGEGTGTAPSVGRAFAMNRDEWKRRLIHRRYPEWAGPKATQQLSVRIEHLGKGGYFPLGTARESLAVTKALRIQQTVVSHGWSRANQLFARELTLAFRWLDDPLAWTYTTIHAQSAAVSNSPVMSVAGPIKCTVAIIEPHAGLGTVLAACVNQQAGFHCGGVFASEAEAAIEVPRRRIQFLLANHAATQLAGPAWAQELRRLQPGLVGLLYSVFEDSDELFKATPGGAAGYLLKRTPPVRIFEPLGDAESPITREMIATRVREYFQKLVSALPAGPSVLELANLTPREHEILALLAKGRLAKEIAGQLGISIWTVHGHVKSIFDKLKVHTRTEAVVKFLQK